MSVIMSLEEMKAERSRRAAAAKKIFNALWQTPTQGDSVPVALEQQGVEVIAPSEEDMKHNLLSLRYDGYDFFITIHEG